MDSQYENLRISLSRIFSTFIFAHVVTKNMDIFDHFVILKPTKFFTCLRNCTFTVTFSAAVKRGMKVPRIERHNYEN